MDSLKLNGPCGAAGPRPAGARLPFGSSSLPDKQAERRLYELYTWHNGPWERILQDGGAALNSRLLKFNIPFGEQPGFRPLAGTPGFKSRLCQLLNSIILNQLLNLSEP